MQELKSFYWLYQPINPAVQVEKCVSMYSQHFVGDGIQDFPTSLVKEEIFRGLLSPTPYWGDLDPRYSLWLIRHSYFVQTEDPHHDHQSVYLLITNLRVVLCLFQMDLGIAALVSVTMLPPIWGHIIATVAEEKGWRIQ